jgi:hypothetical protein
VAKIVGASDCPGSDAAFCLHGHDGNRLAVPHDECERSCGTVSLCVARDCDRVLAGQAGGTRAAEEREVNGAQPTSAQARQFLQRNRFRTFQTWADLLGKERCPFALEVKFRDRVLASRSVRTNVPWRQ